jgi:hypothetical protein
VTRESRANTAASKAVEQQNSSTVAIQFIIDAYHHTQQQVKFLDFHPVQPWIAFADVGDVVKVWDWSTQQVRGAGGAVFLRAA